MPLVEVHIGAQSSQSYSQSTTVYYYKNSTGTLYSQTVSATSSSPYYFTDYVPIGTCFWFKSGYYQVGSVCPVTSGYKTYRYTYSRENVCVFILVAESDGELGDTTNTTGL